MSRYRSQPNRERAVAMQEIRRSNATRSAPPRTPRKQRSRKGAKAAAIRDQRRNW